jgi:hypothetical protein
MASGTGKYRNVVSPFRSAALGLVVGALVAPAVSAQDLRSPDSRDAADGRGTFNAPEVTVLRVTESTPQPSDSLDWGDVATGAGALLGLILLGLGGALVKTPGRSDSAT